MKQYLDIMRDIRENGEWKENRTGIRTLMVDGAMARYDVRSLFPAVTTKKLAWKMVKGELCGFLRGFTSAASFRDFGCRVWDQNANENKQWLANPFRKGEDDLGAVYGAQWRDWKAYKQLDSYPPSSHIDGDAAGDDKFWELSKYLDNWCDRSYEDTAQGVTIYSKKIDQIRDCITKIIKDPDNRRNLFHAWNPAVLDEIALPACHLLYQFLPNKETKEMSLIMVQRSCDLFLGVPFNIASASLLLNIVCHLTGYKPKNFVHFMADAHIYENHIEQVDEQLKREPLPLPKLKITGLKSYEELYRRAVTSFEIAEHDDELEKDMTEGCLIQYIMDEIDNIHPDMFELEGYEHHSAITAPMAV